MYEEQVAVVRKDRLEAERLTAEATQARVEAEQLAAETVRQRGLAEMLAQQAANETIVAQEQAIAALYASEEMERNMTNKARAEFERTQAQIETGQLLHRLRQTHRVSRFSQVALAASLLLSVGLWFGGVDSDVKAEHIANSSSGIVVAQLSPELQVNDSVVLDSLKLSTELGALTAQPVTQGRTETEF